VRNSHGQRCVARRTISETSAAMTRSLSITAA
jgi:hypothetical protein